MKNISALVLAVVAMISLSACQSAVKSAREAGEGHFRARTLIKNKKNSQSFIVNLNFNVVRGQALRLDATSPLNQHVASFLMNGKELTYFIVPEKSYYKGALKPKAFSQFLPVPMESPWLENILFREPFEDKNWSCTKDKSDILVSCLNASEKLDISWSDATDGKMVIKMMHPTGEVQMNFHRIQPKVDEGVSLSALEVPKGFRKL